MATATVTAKGQISIPARIRKRFGIEKGTRLYIEERGEEIVLRPLTADYLDQMAGVLEGPDSLSGMLLADRRSEKTREG